MDIGFLVSGAAVLLLSLVLAGMCAYYYHRGTSTKKYLFSHNTSLLAVVSNVGSVLSIAMLFGGTVPTVVGWGYCAVIVAFGGLTIGYLGLRRSIKRLAEKGALLDPESPYSTNTLLDLVEPAAQPTLRRVQHFYSFSILTLELGVARMLLSALFPGGEPLVIGAVILIGVLCASYVAIGGYAGVLRTDGFQFLVITIGVTAFLSFVVGRSGHGARLLDKEVFNLAFIPGDFLGFIGSLAVAAAFFYSVPDLWIRNVGTLRGKRGQVVTWPLVVAAGMMMLVFVPFIVLGAVVLLEAGGASGEVDLSAGFAVLGRLISTGGGDAQLYWICAALICFAVTTSDTNVLSIMQHLRREQYGGDLGRLSRWPYLIMGVAVLASLTVDMVVLSSWGMFVTLAIFANTGVLANATVRGRQLRDLALPLKVFIAIGLIVTIVLVWSWQSELGARMGWLMGAQLAIGGFAFGLLPLFRGDEARKEA